MYLRPGEGSTLQTRAGTRGERLAQAAPLSRGIRRTDRSRSSVIAATSRSVALASCLPILAADVSIAPTAVNARVAETREGRRLPVGSA